MLNFKALLVKKKSDLLKSKGSFALIFQKKMIIIKIKIKLSSKPHNGWACRHIHMYARRSITSSCRAFRVCLTHSFANVRIISACRTGASRRTAGGASRRTSQSTVVLVVDLGIAFQRCRGSCVNVLLGWANLKYPNAPQFRKPTAILPSMVAQLG